MKLSLLRRSSSGFTLPEVMTTVVILGILSAIAVPQFFTLLQSFEKLDVRQELKADISRARSEAAKEGAKCILTFHTSSYTLGIDYVPYSAQSVPDSVIATRNLPPQFRVTSTAPVIFDSQGFLVDENGDTTQTTVTIRGRDGTTVYAVIYPTGTVTFS